MQRYGSYRPTVFDAAGLALPERADWLVLSFTRTRESDRIAEATFKAVLDRLGGEPDDVEVHRFRHWAIGWYEIILVAPGTVAAKEAEQIDDA